MSVAADSHHQKTARAMPPSLEALGYRNFRLFCFGGLASGIGRFFQVVALPIVIYRLTDSPAWVGLAGFAQLVPMALMAPLAGSIADRHPRRKVLLITQCSLALVSLVFVVLWWSDVRSPTAFVLASVLAGTVAGLNLPAWQAFVSELVPRDVLLNAITLNSAQFNTARMIGPVLGGITVAFAGPGTAFLINALTYVAPVIALSLIRTPDTASPGDEPFRPGRDFVETNRYIATRPGIATAVGVVALIGLFGLSIQTLAVVFAEDVFDKGASGYGLMLTMIGFGAVTSAPFVASLGSRFLRSRLQAVALLVYGTAIIGLAAAPNFYVALAPLALMGAAHLTSASTLNTTVQLQVDESRRAKVLSIYLMALLMANPFGQLALGQMIEWTGPRRAFGVAGGVLLAAAVVLGLSGRLRRLDEEVGTYEPGVMPEVHPTTPVPPRGAHQPGSTSKAS